MSTRKEQNNNKKNNRNNKRKSNKKSNSKNDSKSDCDSIENLKYEIANELGINSLTRSNGLVGRKLTKKLDRNLKCNFKDR